MLYVEFSKERLVPSVVTFRKFIPHILVYCIIVDFAHESHKNGTKQRQLPLPILSRKPALFTVD